jgi:transcriptional repressor NrdR
MKCPQCETEDTKVLESRLSEGGRSVRRRRLCSQCAHRFTTYEKEETLDLLIVKKDGRTESYNREKIFKSIQIACQKRSISYAEINSIVNRIEKRLQEIGEREISSVKVGDLVMTNLQHLDKVAYVRFASVYREFRDMDEFMTTIHQLTPQTK